MRPKKYSKARWLTICVDDKDIVFLDDHRYNMTRGDYLIEAMYQLKASSSNYMKDITKKYKQVSIENHELKQKIMFLESKYKKKTTPETTIFTDPELIKWYNELNMTSKINSMGHGINWENLYDKNINFLSLKLKTPKELQTFCMEQYKNNGKNRNVYIQ